MGGSNARYNGDYIQSEDIYTTDAPQVTKVDLMDPHNDIMSASQDPFRSPGGMGHQQSSQAPHTNAADDALMDDILGELDDL